MINTQDIIKQTTSDTKISILCYVLRQAEVTVTFLSENLCGKRTNISKQINEMKNAGLLDVREEGRNNFYSLTKDLHPEQLKMIKSIVNSYHFVDEGKTDIEFIK